MTQDMRNGKAAEHLVLADLLLRGYDAFLAGEGLHYDVLVNIDNKILKLQVKSITRPSASRKGRRNVGPVYRFTTSSAVYINNKYKYKPKTKYCDVDIWVFVALDLKIISYVTTKEFMKSDREHVPMTFEFKTRTFEYKTSEPNGRSRPLVKGRWLEDYSNFERCKNAL
jgi:hypothetical protein